ncbi:MAG: hypothetical protein GY754_37575, partial [bacterium]|nr:hypothetical protein [bacterium]
MKLKLIIINLVNIVFYLAWLGYTYMKAQSDSYNTSGYSSGPPNITFVYVMVTIIIIASIIFSFAGPANITAKLVWIPIIVIFLGEGFITYKEQRIYNEKIKKRELFESKLKIKVDKISKDYMLKNEEAE